MSGYSRFRTCTFVHSASSIICLLCCLSSTDAQISFTNASTVQVTISDQYARDGEWTKKLAYIVNSGGDNTTGQVCFMREQMCMHVVVKVTAVFR